MEDPDCEESWSFLKVYNRAVEDHVPRKKAKKRFKPPWLCSKGESTTKYHATSTHQTQERLPSRPTSESITGMSNSTYTSNTTPQPTIPVISSTAVPSCSSGMRCSDLSVDCLDCELNSLCIYGQEDNVTCVPKTGVNCTGDIMFMKTFGCRYCYQSDASEHTCTPTTNCRVNSNPPAMIKVNCSINQDVLCLGQRKFHRRNRCNWTSGYRWSTALTLSITLGGFGADRFYLGYWREGLGKLFSFGGLGVWTLVDVVLIAVGYIGPEDGSYFI
ncbi:TM2 domain-containing protein 3-like isoform X2 [Patiria miniata]|uniref:TM2 domain-containing protein n=1 Tax=Patiria miniata TaxID=46514 RepID=A0A914B150_PATMI|nr:TM2 domain-containing protein 3-like isoform X2 [Patiria miniata]